MTSFPPDVMSNPRADRVKAVARLAHRKGREATGEFLAEGPQAVREALVAHRSNDQLVQEVYVVPGFLERHEEFTALLDAAKVRTHFVTGDVISAMADTKNPQGILAVVAMSQPQLSEVLASNPKLIAVLCRIQDPGNAGTILRAADAAGADAVILTKDSVDIYNPKAVRSTVGSLFHLPVLSDVDLNDFIAAAGERLQVLAADGYAAHNLDTLQDSAVLRAGTGTELPANEPALERPTIWLFGNEGQGLDEQEKELAGYKVAVPLYGVAESLNVSTAATVCLYASARAQR
ncbi:RNA methyltransferase [Arthrobacter sp. MYb224]|uniref:TrmH family RNA methyltransferase n=1 Tax=Micrococcaceae TaxID=1268 RepID=UPI000CFD5365|nr:MULTISPECIES: RNA methyltransferase [unclassified Arthrobacter]PQZ96647.1 RNA methyltransferase [Arthrobacter sp. MYb224]PRA01876.1 RNA methyltransferase [Arthrobacter sp. MYb229]PRB50385.1 RNA methyltransferase [Arthrobacter sp. MYb216]